VSYTQFDVGVVHQMRVHLPPASASSQFNNGNRDAQHYNEVVGEVCRKSFYSVFVSGLRSPRTGRVWRRSWRYNAHLRLVKGFSSKHPPVPCSVNLLESSADVIMPSGVVGMQNTIEIAWEHDVRISVW